jgi:acetyl esterase/lipase
MMTIQQWFIFVGMLVVVSVAPADEAVTVTVLRDVPYKSGEGLSEGERGRCKLDVYLPAEKGDWPVMVWFHGGGLTGGDKAKGTELVARYWAQQGVAVVSANYRLSPKVKFPAYLEDGAAAVRWAKEHMGTHGANVNRLFVGGHSAGAYMALMIGLDNRYLAKEGLKLADLAGLVPVSGQTMTHFTVRVERGLDKDRVIADEAAPVHFAGNDGPPMLLLMGDKDWPARLEENAYFVALRRVAGHQETHLLKVAERDHGSIFGKLKDADDPGGRAVLKFLEAPAQFKLKAD